MRRRRNRFGSSGVTTAFTMAAGRLLRLPGRTRAGVSGRRASSGVQLGWFARSRVLTLEDHVNAGHDTNSGGICLLSFADKGEFVLDISGGAAAVAGARTRLLGSGRPALS